jgi:hypothetical protein
MIQLSGRHSNALILDLNDSPCAQRIDFPLHHHSNLSAIRTEFKRVAKYVVEGTLKKRHVPRPNQSGDLCVDAELMAACHPLVIRDHVLDERYQIRLRTGKMQ